MTMVLNILVVDDEEKIRAGCQRILNENGYGVLTAENGQTAWDVMESQSVDMVLLDLRMPVLDGEKLLEMVHPKYPAVPVIIITGHGTVDTAVDCMKKGAYDFVTKPFRTQEFLSTVNRAAEKRSLELLARNLEEERERNLYDLGMEKSRLKTIINCLANGVMVTNRNLELVLHNPALARLMDFTNAIQTPIPLEHAVKDSSILETLNRMLSRETGACELVSQEIECGGKCLRAISAPAPGPNGEPAGTVTVLEDVTPFKELDRMKSDFIAMVAHELRSPLNSVRQLLSVQLEGLCGPIQEKQQEFLERSVRQIDRLLELIQDLLTISKAESDILVQRLAPVDLVDIVKKVMGVMEARAAEKGVGLSLQADGVDSVQADPKSMEEIFCNLLTNAVNYSPDGGPVVIRMQGRPGFLEICVEDSGVGIPSEELPKIFDKFYRIKDPRTRDVAGSGLGLSLVKSLVEAHRGTIEVQSTPGAGTCFKILLPRAKSSESDLSANAEVPI